MGSQEEDPYLVAALDFGTTHSSYAFSYRHDFLKDPLNIKTVVWPGNMDLYTPKAPTVVLLDEQLEFVAFGYEAEDIYADKATDQEHGECRLFQNFTLQLSNPDLDISSDWMIPDTHDNEAPAIVVYSAVFKFYQKHLQKTLVNHTGHDETHPVRWVIVVPATWNDSAREFLLAATQEAGFDGDHVFLADAPEMILLHNKYLKSQTSVLLPRNRVMVVDLGGGGVEMTVYEIINDKEIEIVHKEYHTSLGSRILNDLLILFLSDMFNADPEALKTSLKTNHSDYIDLLRNFEVIKRLVGGDSSKALTLKLPLSFTQTIHEITSGNTLEQGISSNELDSYVSVVKGNLRMDRNILNMIFTEFINQIIIIVCKLDEDFADKSTPITHILLAGGFSECKLLQDEISTRKNKVQTFNESGIAAMKGAVTYGHDLESIICLNTTENTVLSFEAFVAVSGLGTETIADDTVEALETFQLLQQANLRTLQEEYEEEYEAVCENFEDQSEADEDDADRQETESISGAAFHMLVGAEAQVMNEGEFQVENESEFKALNEAELQAQLVEEIEKGVREAEMQAEIKRQEEAEAQRLREAEAQRQREAELQRQREAELQRQREAELQRQREAELQRQREAELQRQREAELQRQREAELQRQREAELQKQREVELKKQREAEAQRQRDAEFKRQQEQAEHRRQQLFAEQENNKPKKSKFCTIL